VGSWKRTRKEDTIGDEQDTETRRLIARREDETLEKRVTYKLHVVVFIHTRTDKRVALAESRYCGFFFLP
jgi:hypothetical protein